MKVLFVCKGNVGRSQMAEVIFNKLSKHKASSAGIVVGEKEGQRIKDTPLTDLVIESMKKEGIDVSENKRKQLKPKDLDNFDKIVVMAQPEVILDYLKKRNNVEFWKIKDPYGMNKKEHYEVVSQIKNLVRDFIKENNL